MTQVSFVTPEDSQTSCEVGQGLVEYICWENNTFCPKQTFAYLCQSDSQTKDKNVVLAKSWFKSRDEMRQ